MGDGRRDRFALARREAVQAASVDPNEREQRRLAKARRDALKAMNPNVSPDWWPEETT